VVVGACLLAACSAPEDAPVVSRGARPAEKRICAEAVPDSDLEALDRELVPYGPDVLGVESTWGDGTGRLVVYSGGFFDDIFEAYDDLEPYGTAEVRGQSATLLSASFLGDEVWAATWREDDETPCDAHAVLTVGMAEAEFLRHLGAIG
jgi:hypothetical protein